MYDDTGRKTGLVKAVWQKTTTLLLGHDKKMVRLGQAFEYKDDQEFMDFLRIRSKNRASAIVYIHGYNNSFEDAARALATLYMRAGLARYNVVPVLFAWPSKAHAYMYMSDMQKAKNSQLDLLTALSVCMRNCPIHVLAHSHGASLLVDSLSLADNKLSELRSPPIDQIIFVAPDVDKLLFEQRKHHVVASCTRSTIYASSADLALRLSSIISSGDRLGGILESGQAKIDIIDVTPACSSEFREHSHHLYISEVAYDISEVLRGIDARNRGPWLRLDSEQNRIYTLVPGT
jgi:esterase/lipase superfamily enzyme